MATRGERTEPRSRAADATELSQPTEWHSRRNHHHAIDNAAVRGIYAGLGGAALKTLSVLSLHVPLSERWFRDRTFDLCGAKRILDAGCGAGQLTRHLARYADPDASITACDFSVEMLLRARQRLQGSSIQFVLGDLCDKKCRLQT